jgi:hypothetical protein
VWFWFAAESGTRWSVRASTFTDTDSDIPHASPPIQRRPQSPIQAQTPSHPSGETQSSAAENIEKSRKMDDDLDALMSEIESAGLVGGTGGGVSGGGRISGGGKVGGGGRIPTASGSASASSNAPVVARASSLALPRRGLPSL